MFSAACESFNRRVDDVKNNCAVALNEHPQKAKCYRFLFDFENNPKQTAILQTATVVRGRVDSVNLRCSLVRSSKRVCGLFAVDAALPLRLLGLVTTYCIVLLQIAFLYGHQSKTQIRSFVSRGTVLASQVNLPLCLLAFVGGSRFPSCRVRTIGCEKAGNHQATAHIVALG
ncbi:hypothetical protein EVAR_44978_1 [Eumeta japonica]|uniref:Uncharacterized protein n=1 Tax=Eumeta variegata TaxID=151549 RepID=A0A4C1XG13_EUMVA|nr:hypothetical protein EVAR_44978_1 [Eumeta japonica]